MFVINGKEVFTTLDEVVDARHTALLLIDIQNDYVAPGGYCDRLGTALPLRGIVPHGKARPGGRAGDLISHAGFSRMPEAVVS